VLNFQRDLEAFQKLDTEIIGVSKDRIEKNQKFASENGISFPLVSDSDKSIRKKYGRGRVTFVIDTSGIIRHIQKGVPDNQKLLKVIKDVSP
jgi:peroxiredoxin Q/BCP